MNDIQRKIAKLKKTMQAQRTKIIKAARQKRKKVKNKEAVTRWELNKLRHLEVKYLAELDKLLNLLGHVLKPSKPKKFIRRIARDKRPSQKHKKLSLAQ